MSKTRTLRVQLQHYGRFGTTVIGHSCELPDSGHSDFDRHCFTVFIRHLPMIDPSHPLAKLLKKDRRYKFDAYVFVFEALTYAQKVLGMGDAAHFG